MEEFTPGISKPSFIMNDNVVSLKLVNMEFDRVYLSGKSLKYLEMYKVGNIIYNALKVSGFYQKDGTTLLRNRFTYNAEETVKYVKKMKVIK